MDISQYLRNLQPPTGPVDVVLDSDTFNEADDQFAMAYLLLSAPALTVRGLCAAPFLNALVTSPAEGMEKSCGEMHHLLQLMGRTDLERLVRRGSDRYLPDEQTPVVSEAAEFLVQLSRNYTPEKPLYIVAIGAITNVASALLLEPEMKERTVVVWLGGNAHHRNPSPEFNLMQDVTAARVVFGSGVPLVQLPCRGVIDRFHTTGPELEYWLRGKNALCDYLVDHTFDYARRRLDPSGPWSKPLWDVTAVGWLLNRDQQFLEYDIRPRPIPQPGHAYSFDTAQAPMAYAYAVNRDALYADLFRKLTQA